MRRVPSWGTAAPFSTSPFFLLLCLEPSLRDGTVGPRLRLLGSRGPGALGRGSRWDLRESRVFLESQSSASRQCDIGKPVFNLLRVEKISQVNDRGMDIDF